MQQGELRQFNVFYLQSTSLCAPKGDMVMKVRFWGTRGSIPVPGPTTVRYGGNTSCVEVRSASGVLMLLDCGTGALGFGQALLAEPGGPRSGHVFIGHTHWDHIQGLPFLAPLFVPGFEWDLYGPRGLGPSLREALEGQMQYTYFPITVEQFAAQVRYHDLVEGGFSIGDVRISAHYMNHPALTLGYRIEADGATLVYATDHEPHTPALACGAHPPRSREERSHAAFVDGADLLIHDAQYTLAEYPGHVGWGHSPVEFAVDLAAAGRVRRLALFHHDPQRDDNAVDRIVASARLRAAGTGVDVFGACEGLVVELRGAGDTAAFGVIEALASATAQPAALALAAERSVLIVAEPEPEAVLAAAVKADGSRLLVARDAATLHAVVAQERPDLLVLQRDFAGGDALTLCHDIRSRPGADLDTLVIIMLVSNQRDVDLEAGGAAGATDWLVWPFKETYARTRMHAWILRQACRWQAAPLPANEAQRLHALHGLQLLDTAPEERFDRYTRIAAGLFNVPIALVSLVDDDRQWIKSRHGTEFVEGPRDSAFCAHAILDGEVMQVHDALEDLRFADNPAVAGEERVRFYAGAPLEAADGSRVGTLCLVDRRPRQLDEQQLSLLRDLADLVQAELVKPGDAVRQPPTVQSA